MRIAFIGAVASSHTILGHLRNLPDVELVGVITRAQSPFNADAHSLESLAAEIGCPCLVVDRQPNADLAAWLKQRSPDVIYCMGWSWLLKSDVLAVAPLGVVGYHPAALPRNRGRHPIVWALALGLPETASTFFFMDECADSGDILDQVALPISAEDDAATLYARLEQTAIVQVTAITRNLAAGTAKRRPQEHAQANYWRKRGQADGRIDWRMPAQGVHNLIRALTRPYVGAHCVWNGVDIKVWRSLLSPLGGDNIEPGKVLAVDGSRITVKCGSGSVILVEHQFDQVPTEGDYFR